MQNGRDQWNNLQQIVSERFKKFGDWKSANFEDIDNSVKENIIKGRKQFKKTIAKENSKKSGNWKSKKSES